MREGIPVPKMSILSFHEALVSSELVLSHSLDGAVKISSHNVFNDEIIDEVYKLDHSKFREELWYDRDELVEMFSKPGFFCILVHLDGGVIAYDFGYDESEGVFFSDSTATIIEKKGIGTFLGVLELVYLFENGYKKVKFRTEEKDQTGRPLRLIWEKRGYKMVSSDERGIAMELDIEQGVVNERVEKHITGALV